MLEISAISKRFFSVKITVTDESEKEKSISLEIEPPKIKTLKKLIAVSKSSNEDAMDDLTEAVRKLLNKNKAKYEVPQDFIEALDFDQLQEVLNGYFDWLKESQNSPN